MFSEAEIVDGADRENYRHWPYFRAGTRHPKKFAPLDDPAGLAT